LTEITVDALLDFSQKSGIYDFMHSTWGWPAVETLHFMGLSLLIGTVGLFDLRMLGLAKGIPMNALHRLVPWGVGGYALNVMTGVMFVTSAPDQYLFNPAFQVKLALMADAPRAAKVAAAISLCCWIGVIVCGRLITYYRPPYHWCFWC
jgi:hypothetical protein